MREGTHNNLHAPTVVSFVVRRIKLFQWGDAFHMRVVVVRLGITPSSVDPSEHSHSVFGGDILYPYECMQCIQ